MFSSSHVTTPLTRHPYSRPASIANRNLPFQVPSAELPLASFGRSVSSKGISPYPAWPTLRLLASVQFLAKSRDDFHPRPEPINAGIEWRDHRAAFRNDRKDMHRGPDDDDILDRIRQPFPQRRLLSHSQINSLGDCRGSNAHDVAMRVLLPSRRALRCVSSYLSIFS